ncbi:putative inositol monophosphatase 3 [Armigeres subalbatus]|uniref:putative inositol monophosphatase 3 n=1 Tax=Armigeres subalbatus TaxID=124917 RepID=UPI002ED28F1F
MNLGGSIRINKFGVLIITILLVFLVYYISTGKSRNSNYALNKNPNEVNLRKLLIGSIQAAQRGGLEVVEVSKSPDFNVQSKGKTKEGANDPVTDADFRSHCVMASGLHRIFPKLKIISEEDGEGKSCPDVKLFDLDPTVIHESSNVPDEIVGIEDVTVWIDPLDATQEYTENLFMYVTTMVCVAIKGVPTIGVIHNPFTKKTVWAWADKTVSEPLNVIKRDEDVKHPVVIVSRSHSGNVNILAKDVFGKNSHIIPAGGAGYKVLQVLHNNATAYLHSTAIKKWDICAGNAILAAIGGRMTTQQNQDISYSDKDSYVNEHGLLATAVGGVHELYIKKLIEHQKTLH